VELRTVKGEIKESKSKENWKDKVKEEFSEETKRNLVEFERLKKCYPLLNLELDDDNYHLTSHTGSNSSFHTTIDDGQIDHETITMFDKDHLALTMEQNLMALYPDLFIGVFMNKDECEVSCWVNRPQNGKPCGHEAIGSIDITDINLHPTLYKWQLSSFFAKKPNYFFCSGHGCAEPKSHFGYFYFAGNYCKKWGDEHPENRRAAARETYE